MSPSALFEPPAPNQRLSHRRAGTKSTSPSPLLLLKQHFKGHFRCSCPISESQLTRLRGNHRSARPGAGPAAWHGAQGTGWAARLPATALCTGKGALGGLNGAGGGLHRQRARGCAHRGHARGGSCKGRAWSSAHGAVCTDGVHGALCTPLPFFFFFWCQIQLELVSLGSTRGWRGTAGCSPTIPVHPAARPRPHPSTHQGPATAPLIKRGRSQGRFLLMYHCQAGQTARGPRPSSSSRISRHPEHRGLLGTTAPQGWQKYLWLISC